jgi:hypothetical protein
MAVPLKLTSVTPTTGLLGEIAPVNATLWKLSTTVPVAVEVWLLLSVTVSVTVLLGVLNGYVQVEESEQIAVPLLFHA